MAEKRGLIVLFGLFFLFVLIFSDRAYHIDDPLYVNVARQVQLTPFDPYSGHYTTRQNSPESTFSVMLHPPLLVYFLAGVSSLLGDGERTYHLCFALFSYLAICSLYLLARRFSKSALLAAVFFAASPIFLLSAASLMTDLPVLSLSLAALFFFIQSVEQEKRRYELLAGLGAGLAALTKYTGLFVIALWLVYVLLLSPKRKAWRSFVFCSVLAVFPVLLWNLFTLHQYGASHLGNSLHELSLLPDIGLFPRLVAVASFFGGLSIFPLLMLIVFSYRWRSAKDLLRFALIVVLSVLVSLKAGYRGTSLLLLSLNLFLAATFVLEALLFSLGRQGIEKRKDLFLLFWLLFGLFLAAFSTPFVAARFLCFALPAFALLTVRIFADALSTPWIRGTGVLSSICFSLLLLCVDQTWAGSYRALPFDIEARRPGFFLNHWGMQYYLEKEGWSLFTAESKPQAGDLLLVSSIVPGDKELLKRFNLAAVSTVTFRPPFPFVLNGADAGFYIHHSGLLPYAISRKPLDVITCYRVLEQNE